MGEEDIISGTNHLRNLRVLKNVHFAKHFNAKFSNQKIPIEYLDKYSDKHSDLSLI
jgi:hypothetical protein